MATIKEDNNEIESNNSNFWRKIGPFILTEFDRKILESTNEWITDSIINCSQYLLQKQYPSIKGLQDVVLGQLDQFKPVEGKFVQILIENREHWFTISNIFNEENSISIYDSRSDDKSEYKESALLPVFGLLSPSTDEITFIVEQVTQQIDNSQCGLLAIAFASALCDGINPSKILFTDDPQLLREHLIDCLESNQITLFPFGSESPLEKFKLKRRILDT